MSVSSSFLEASFFSTSKFFYRLLFNGQNKRKFVGLILNKKSISSIRRIGTDLHFTNEFNFSLNFCFARVSIA